MAREPVTWFVHSLEKKGSPDWPLDMRLVGPFTTDDEAEEWAERHLPAEAVWYTEDCVSPEAAERSGGRDR